MPVTGPPPPAELPAILLVHGGLWEPMDAERFWVRPGIVAALRERGRTVLAPDRSTRARDWASEADHLAAALPAAPAVLVAGSNGCSAAVRLALARPSAVVSLVLAWPATAGDPRVDASTRDGLLSAGATAATLAALLTGGALRGVDDTELATLRLPVAVLPAEPENPHHARRTAAALLRIVPGAVGLPGCPEPPRAEFAGRAGTFADAVLSFVEAAG